MVSFIISAIKIIFLLGFLIFIHELGHFTVAKICKVKVNEFSIGFGPTILKKKGLQTKYSLRLIPLGGFISMEGESEKSEEECSFSKASIPKRIAIVAAGAIVNIIFAIVVYFILVFISGTYVTNEITDTLDGYPAKNAGLQTGDKIIKIKDMEIKNIYDINNALSSNDEELNVEVDRNGNIIDYQMQTETVNVDGYSLHYLGVTLKPSEDNFINRCINRCIRD